MQFFKNLFKKRSTFPPVPSEFRTWVKASIEFWGALPDDLEPEAFYEAFLQQDIPEAEADEIFLFLPTAFCRKLLPEVQWLPHYVDYYTPSKQLKQAYKDNPRYVIIAEETDYYWANNLKQSVILRIAGSSAEFDAINQMLQNGGALEDCVPVENRIIRHSA